MKEKPKNRTLTVNLLLSCLLVLLTAGLLHAQKAENGEVWIPYWYSGTVARINGSSLAVTPVPVQGHPNGVAVDDAYVWVASRGNNETDDLGFVTRITKSDLSTAPIGAGSGTHGIAVDDAYAWVTNYYDHTLWRIKKDMSAPPKIYDGLPYPYPMGVAVDATHVWITHVNDNYISMIDKATDSVTPIAVPGAPSFITADETYVWVSLQRGDFVARIAKADLTQKLIPVASDANGIAVDNDFVWVCHPQGYKMTRISKSSLTTEEFDADDYNWPIGVGVDKNYVWATHYNSNLVYRVDKSGPNKLLPQPVPGTDMPGRANGYGDMTGISYDRFFSDTTAPTLNPVASQTVLWPPNHKMAPVTIQANAADNSVMPVVLSATVACNENGAGFWTTPAIDQATGIISLSLMSERFGNGNGRQYTISITATDQSGNSSTANVMITVPHDQGKN